MIDKIKGEIDIENVNYVQTFAWFREGFEIVPTKEQMKALLTLADKIEKDLEDLPKLRKRWSAVKALPLTAKQKDKLLDEL